jgi:hypothetical protein
VEGVGLSIAQRGGLKRLDEIAARAGGHGARERVTLIRAQICPVGYAAQVGRMQPTCTPNPPYYAPAQPLTAPAVSPWIKWRCRNTNRTATGTVLMMTPADSGPHCTSYCPTM